MWLVRKDGYWTHVRPMCLSTPLSGNPSVWLELLDWVFPLGYKHLITRQVPSTTRLGMLHELGSHLGSIKSLQTLKLFLLFHFLMPASPTHQNLLTLGCLSWTSWKNKSVPSGCSSHPSFSWWTHPKLLNPLSRCPWSQSIRSLLQTCFAPFHTPLSSPPSNLRLMFEIALCKLCVPPSHWRSKSETRGK